MQIGLALSSGGAATMAQIGVLEVLQQEGVRFACAAGTSGGSIVGAALCAGRLEGLRDAVTGLSRPRVLSLFDPTWPRVGMLEGRRALELVRPHLGERIEDLPIRFGASAVDLDTGREVELTEGDVLEAVRASAAVPGILTPALRHGRHLADGGLVNPIPVSVARRLGASFVLAVNVLPLAEEFFIESQQRSGKALPFAAQILSFFPGWGGAESQPSDDSRQSGLTPAERRGLVDVVTRAGHVAQCQIAALRLHLERPEFLLTVPVPSVGIFEFERSAELIATGREAAQRALPALRAALTGATPVHHRLLQWLAPSDEANGNSDPAAGGEDSKTASDEFD